MILFRGWFAFLVVCLFSTASVFADKKDNKESTVAPESSDVVLLTDSDFDKFIDANPIVLVMFFVPWCGHCRDLAPEYTKAAATLKTSGIPLAKVDAQAETELAQKYEVQGYPTLKLFRNGKPEEYRGGRTAETIVSWVNKMTGPAVVELASKERAVEAAKEADTAFLGSFKSWEEPIAKAFKKVANDNRHAGKFVAYADAAAKNEVTAFRKVEGGANAVSSAETVESLEKFIATERFALFGPISVDNYADYFGNGKEMVWFAGEKKHYEKYEQQIRTVAGSFRDVFNFVWLDTDKFKDHASSALGVKEFPALVLQSKTGRYVYPGSPSEKPNFESAEPIKKFLQDCRSGKVEKYYMSEPIPTENEGPVKVVVGKSFKEEILHPTRDAFLMIYASWCGHCKKFKPIYEEFAEKVKDKNLLVAKMDGTENEAPVPNFDFRGFPTLFFVKAGSDKPITFDGARTVEALIEFVEKNGSGAVKGSAAESPEKEEL